MKEAEKYSIHDGGQFLITGFAVAIVIVIMKALDLPFGIFKALIYMLPYFLGLAVLMAVNAFGIMVQKKGHLIGALIEKITYVGLFALSFYTISSLGL